MMDGIATICHNGTMRQSSIPQQILKILKEIPGQHTIKSITAHIYGADYNISNYNYVQKFIRTLQTEGKLIRGFDGSLSLTDSNIRTIVLPKKREDYPFTLPSVLSTVEEMQDFIDRSKWLKGIIGACQEDFDTYKESLKDAYRIQWSDTVGQEEVAFAFIAFLLYFNILFDNKDFINAFKIKSHTPVDPDFLVRQIMYFTAEETRRYE